MGSSERAPLNVSPLRMRLHLHNALFRSLTCFTCQSKGGSSIPFASSRSDSVKTSSPGVVPMCYSLLVMLENVCCSHLSTSYYRDVTCICFRRHLHHVTKKDGPYMQLAHYSFCVELQSHYCYRV